MFCICDGTGNGTDDNRVREGRCCRWMNKWCACSRCCLSDWDQRCPRRVISFFGELGCQNMGSGVTVVCVWGCGGGGAGGAPLGRAPGWSGRAGRPSALPPPLLGAGRWAGRSGAWGPAWCLVPVMARASCLSVGSYSRWSSVLFARSASGSHVLPRSVVAAVNFPREL